MVSDKKVVSTGKERLRVLGEENCTVYQLESSGNVHTFKWDNSELNEVTIYKSVYSIKRNN